MNVSNAGKELIKFYEEYSEEVYEDSEGNPTAGYGHLVTDGDNLTMC